MADEKMVTVALKRTYRKGANSYGPGEAVQVPASLALGLGLAQADALKAKDKKSTKKGAK